MFPKSSIFGQISFRKKKHVKPGTVLIMTVRVVEFSNGVCKIRKIFALKSTYPKEIIEF
jgi:hypothetical protein